MKEQYLLFDATSYCFGPAGSLDPIVRELYALLGKSFKFVFVGYGSSMELMKKNPCFSDFYTVDTEDFYALEKETQLIDNASAIITNTNPVMAIFAKGRGKKVFFVDILPWMHNTVSKKIESVTNLNNNKQYFWEHPEAAELLASVDMYIYQKYLINFNLDKKYQNTFEVAPISQVQINNKEKDINNRIVISTGGLFSPDIDAEKTLIQFANQVVESAVNASKNKTIEEIVICGPKLLREKLNYKNFGAFLKVVCLDHEEFLEIISSSRYLAIVPGLTTIYETFLTNNPTLLLPSTNYSQILQTNAVFEADLGDELVCEDIFAQIGDECIEVGEMVGTGRMMEYMAECVNNGTLKRILDKGFEELLQADETGRISKRRRLHIENMGKNGAKEIAGKICKCL